MISDAGSGSTKTQTHTGGQPQQTSGGGQRGPPSGNVNPGPNWSTQQNGPVSGGQTRNWNSGPPRGSHNQNSQQQRKGYQNGPPQNWFNARGNTSYQNGPSQNRNGPNTQNRNWNGRSSQGGPPRNWNGPNQGGPPQGWNGPNPGGPPQGWNGPNQGGPPKGWNGPNQGGPPQGWNGPNQGGPPQGWNGPNQGGPSQNWKGPIQSGPPQNRNGQNQNGTPANWNNSPQNMNAGGNQNGPSPYNGPPPNWNPGPSYNWNYNQQMGGPPSNWNGPSGANWNWNGPPPPGYGPNPAFMAHHYGNSPPGVGIALVDPDLPDGLDDRFQQMQAAHAMKQMGIDMGPPLPMPMPPLPMPGQGQLPPWTSKGQSQSSKTSGTNQAQSQRRVGWPIRPSHRAGFWNPSETPSPTNSTKTNSTTVTSPPPDLSTRPSLAEFRQQPPTPQLAEFQKQPTSRQLTNFTGTVPNEGNQYRYNPYRQYNSGVYGPVGFNNYWKPEVPDHLEDRGRAGKNSTTNFRLQATQLKTDPYNTKAPRVPNLSSNRGREYEREIIGETIPRQRLQGLTKSISPSWGSDQRPPRREFYNPQSRMPQRLPSRRRGDDPERSRTIRQKKPVSRTKTDGDYETETEVDKEEDAKPVDPRIVRRVLEVIKEQRGGGSPSLDSVMDGLNNQGYKFRMKYKYEGDVPPPSWVDRIGNVGPESTTAPPTNSTAISEGTIPIKLLTLPQPSELVMTPARAVRKQPNPLIPKRLPSLNPTNYPKFDTSKPFTLHSFPTFGPAGSSATSQAPRSFGFRNTQNTQWQAGPRSVIGTAIHQEERPGNERESSNIPHLADILNIQQTTSRRFELQFSSTTPSVADFEVKVEKGPNGPEVHVEHDPSESPEGAIVPTNQHISRKPNSFNNSNAQSVTMKSFVRLQNESTNILTPNSSKKLQQMEPVPAPEISGAQAFGIIAGVIIGFLVILAPIVCFLCRVRDKRKQKQRKLSAKRTPTKAQDDGGLMEAMIVSELGMSDAVASTSGARPKSKWIGGKSNNIEENSYSELQELKSNRETTTVEVH